MKKLLILIFLTVSLSATCQIKQVYKNIVRYPKDTTRYYPTLYGYENKGDTLFVYHINSYTTSNMSLLLEIARYDLFHIPFMDDCIIQRDVFVYKEGQIRFLKKETVKTFYKTEMREEQIPYKIWKE